MNTHVGFEKCVSFITSQFRSDSEGFLAAGKQASKLAITISRQSGSGGHAVGEKLAEYLKSHSPDSTLPWMLFDRNLVEKVLEDNHLPGYLVRSMPEDRVTDLTDMLHGMFGIHPPFWTLVHQTAETILRLAKQGNVILIGRGANLVTRELPYAFHVRLVGSLEKRTAHTQEIRNLGKKAALDLIHAEDRGRERYLKKYFNQNPDDPLLYDLVINTDSVSYEEAAHLIGTAALRKINYQVEPAPNRWSPETELVYAHGS